ncbi:MAG: DNA polymerase IV [Candidatus Omnitrophica bacterium]|nr:DNA polymerase IV [Candidatus Omnitrophota bacterium]
MRTIAHIDMDAFFAAVEQRDNPSLQGKPVIIGADPKFGKGRGVVSTCSYEARRYKIHSAMPISQAYRLCPHGIYLAPNIKKYKTASQIIFSILHDFTPDVEPVSIDEAFLDLTGCYHFYQTPVNCARVIKTKIKNELNLNASIGLAPNKMVAKIASDMSKPDGLLEIKQEKMLLFLAALPVEKLWGVGGKTKELLNKSGIKTVGDIGAMELSQLKKVLGSQGEHLYWLSRGVDDRPVAVDREVKSVSHEHTFDEDTSNKENLRSCLSKLSEKVSYRLRRLGLKGRSLSLKIRLDNFKTFTRAHTFTQRVNQFDPIFQESLKLFNEFYRDGWKVRLIGVRLSHFSDPFMGDNLFSDPLVEKREQVHQALDQIKNKFGEHSIQRGRVI